MTVQAFSETFCQKLIKKSADKYGIISIGTEFLPIIYVPTKGECNMTLLEMIYAVVNAETHDERMKLVEDNIDMVKVANDYDPDADTQKYDELKGKYDQLTSDNDELKKKYFDAFFSGNGRTADTPPNDPPTDEPPADGLPQSIEELNLTVN